MQSKNEKNLIKKKANEYTEEANKATCATIRKRYKFGCKEIDLKDGKKPIKMIGIKKENKKKKRFKIISQFEANEWPP